MVRKTSKQGHEPGLTFRKQNDDDTSLEEAELKQQEVGPDCKSLKPACP